MGDPKKPYRAWATLNPHASETEACGTRQRRFYDFNVWSHKKKTEKLQYMHCNPVKRGLVCDPKDWPWSSCSFYAGRNDGLLSVDSA